jgi:hypothetical protein
LINGDDVAFPTNAEGYQLWKKITALGGLIFSQGKNFTSTEFLIINSCLFNVHLVQRMPMRSSGPRYEERSRPHVSPVGLTSNPNDWRLLHEPLVPAKPMRVIHDTESELLFRLKLIPDQPKSISFAWTGGPVACFSVAPWQNPDFLGPVGRYLPMGTISCPAFERMELRTTDQLFEPDGYAILPGLQSSWLGRTRGVERHQLNLIWLRSWKPVLDLTQGVFRTTKFSANYFLPCELGGLGLEETSNQRIDQFATFATRQLAYWLWRNPEEAPMQLPSISKKSPVEDSVARHIRSLPVQFVPKTAVLNQDQLSHADLLCSVNRTHWFSTFSLERHGPSYKRGFDEGERSVWLDERLASWRESRVRLWATRSHGGVRKKWSKCPPLSDEQLANFVPRQRVYKLLAPSGYRTSLRLPGIPLFPDSSLQPELPLLGLDSGYIGSEGFSDLLTGRSGYCVRTSPSTIAPPIMNRMKDFDAHPHGDCAYNELSDYSQVEALRLQTGATDSEPYGFHTVGFACQRD